MPAHCAAAFPRSAALSAPREMRCDLCDQLRLARSKIHTHVNIHAHIHLRVHMHLCRARDERATGAHAFRTYTCVSPLFWYPAIQDGFPHFSVAGTGVSLQSSCQRKASTSRIARSAGAPAFCRRAECPMHLNAIVRTPEQKQNLSAATASVCKKN